jgi:hypothetical protein
MANNQKPAVPVQAARPAKHFADAGDVNLHFARTRHAENSSDQAKFHRHYKKRTLRYTAEGVGHIKIIYNINAKR